MENTENISVDASQQASGLQKDAAYWSELISQSGSYVRFRNIKTRHYGKQCVRLCNARVQEFIRAQNCPLFVFCGSIFALYLARINRLDGCLLNTAVPAKEAGAGSLNTLLKIDVARTGSFRDLTAAFQHGYQEAVLHTAAGTEPFFRERLSYDSVYDVNGADEAARAQFGDGSAMTLLIAEDACTLRYHADTFSADFIARAVRNLESLAETVLDNPDLPVSEISILSAEEQAQITAFSRGKTVPVDFETPFAEAFRRYAAAEPDVIAVDDGVDQVSYGELERFSNSIADDLYRRYGIRPGTRVALMLPRNYHFPELVLALSIIGAAFIPVDPLFPANRIRYMLTISQADCLITTSALTERPELDIRTILLEDIDRNSDAVPEVLAKNEHLLVILFTSGTTGQPKGVPFYNRQIPWAAAALNEIFNLKPGDRIGSFFSFSFVASLFAIIALNAGCTLRLFHEQEQKNSLLLIKALKEHHMSNLILPPAVGIPLYENEDLNLDYLVLAGAKLNELSRKERHTRLVNLYGTTEIAFAVSKIYDLHKRTDDERVPVGRPVANTWVYILDADNNPMPIGVPGEICISSGIAASSYCDASEQGGFEPNPFAENEANQIMYRTGDIGFFNEEGDVEIVGREDDQLSVRGFRIESGEIIGILKRFDAVSEICLDVENDNLIAYYTAAADVDPAELTEAVRRELPYYMVPSAMIRLDRIPLNINGKIDREQLRKRNAHKEAVITDETLAAVVAAYKAVLHLDAVQPDDEFAALGGNSLSAMELQLLLREKLNVTLSSGELLGLSTPRAVADYIKASGARQPAFDADKYSFDGLCPLSESQLNVYLDESVHEMGTAYNNPFCIRFADQAVCAPDRLRNALHRLTEVFPVLKARVLNRDAALFLSFDAEPVITEGGAEAVSTFVQRFETDKYLARFLIAEETGSTVLCADFHHLIFDGTSLNVWMNALFALLTGAEIDVTDRGVLAEAAFEEQVHAEGMDKARAFFDEMLAAHDEVCELLPSVQAADAPYEHTVSFELDNAQLNAFLRAHSVTHNQFFAAVFAYTLSRFTGSEKTLFDLIEDGRGHMDLSRSVGMFVKTLPVLIDCKNQAAGDFLRSVSARINAVMQYDLYPYRLLAGEYELNRNILFQYSHDIFSEAVGNDRLAHEISEMQHDLIADLSFNIFNYGRDRFTIRILSSVRYEKAFIERFAESYQMILRGMLSEKQLGGIRYTSDSDLRLLDSRNQTDAPVAYSDVIEAFQETLAKYPGHKLVEYGDVSYTFSEGAYFADRVRQKLLSLGVRKDDTVGFLVPRSELYVFCVLGIMAMGGTYVPLDDALPDERIAFMIRDAGAGVLIVSDDTAARAEKLDISGVTLLSLSEIMREPAGTPDRFPVSRGELACLLYTSGSTGIPKGVKITRDSLRFFIDFHVHDLDIQPDDVYGMYASIGFDVSMAAIFSVFCTGACLNVIPGSIKLNIQALSSHFAAHHITHTYITTQIAKLFISQVETTTLKVLVAGGEKLGEIREQRHYRIVDAYGPTEACVYVISAATVDKMDASSVGYVQNNTKAYILDSERRRVPVGAAGGLFLSGPQLAGGYLNRDAENAAAFLKNPFESGEKYGRMYATGDVARILPDGTYGIVGRRDHQVKIRGNRVELTAVEAVIRQMEPVQDVTVRVIGRGGNNELTAYVVADGMDEQAIGTAVTEYLSGRVPDYMVPAFVIKLDKIPLNVNGKVDQRALPAVDLSQLHAEFAAPENDLERKVVRGFEQVFETKKLSVHDDFVRLGGDSLTAVKLLSVLEESGLTAADILALRTPAAIAAGIRNTSMDLDLYTVESGCPMTHSQLSVFDDVQQRAKSDSYLLPSMVSVPGTYSDEQIIDALHTVFRAHPVMTMHAAVKDGVPYLVKGEDPPVLKGSLNPITVLSRLSADFDIGKYFSRHMIVRFLGKCWLLSVFHHINFDIISDNVFKREFLRALAGTAPEHTDETFLKLSAFQQQFRQTEAYAKTDAAAREKLGNLEGVGFLRNPGKHGKSGYIFKEIGVSRAQVKQAADRLGVNKNILFTAAMACTLSRMTASEDVFFSFVENGRDRFRSYDAIGLYINVLPLIAHTAHQTFGELLEKLSDQYYEMTRNSFYPYSRLGQEFRISPLILFQFLPDWIIDDGGHDELPLNETMINLILSRAGDLVVEALTEVVEKEDSYIMRIYYSAYYPRKMMKTLAETYRLILSQILCADENTAADDLLNLTAGQ